MKNHLFNLMIFCCTTAIIASCNNPSAVNIQIDEIFTDHAVLQRDAEVPVWGTAGPGGTVKVEVGDAVALAEVDQNGNWMVELPALKAGGPYPMHIIGKDTTTLKNILVGDVWLASGQSNMEWPLNAQVDNYEEEIANANYPKIRLFTVEKNRSDAPLKDMRTEGWQVCSPETIGDFSAVAYFFGREIHQEENVPIGLIDATWGGTPAEAWTSEKSLMKMEDFRQMITENKKANQGESGMSEAEKAKRREEIIQQAEARIQAAGFTPDSDMSQWKTMELPVLWEEADTSMRNFDGFVWFAKKITIPSRYAGKALTLHLGKIDDQDITWFNGEKIGSTNSYSVSRIYEVPAQLVKSGENTIIVRVLDTGGGGGMYGPAEEMYLAQNGQQLPVSLSGGWQYDETQEPRLPVASPYPNEPAILFNAMINPLIPYSIKGAIWYQGESNASRAKQYQTLFPLMIEDWREQFGQGKFPFLFVQLANFEPQGAPPAEWAELREAQMMALDLDHTGVAVTIDIGDPDDIHPRNKQDVGYRLALAARKVAYHRDNIYSSPLYDTMRVATDTAYIKFTEVGEGLMKMPDEELRGFTIAGEDKQFVQAKAKIISKDEVAVYSAQVKNPQAVRYGWSNNPDVNLYNMEGLPASPFRTDPGEHVQQKDTMVSNR